MRVLNEPFGLVYLLLKDTVAHAGGAYHAGRPPEQLLRLGLEMEILVEAACHAAS
ncbi:MAG: hypothetical protein JSW59_07465 [Phycisphaerales bacterium]|nr:MAG: hypothetical protein JSW59_07465 [Phycisphaerales bacterium]